MLSEEEAKLRELTCTCGGDTKPHNIGDEKCYRKIATGDLIPTNFRTDDRGYQVCDVRGHTITQYTLTNQRSYYRHEDGRWSLPKNEDSVNSMEVD